MKGLTQIKLKELLHYDPESGAFFRKIRTSNRIKVGEIVSGLDSKGYLRVCLLGRRHILHRLAWLYIYGEMPLIVDHVNGIKTDNRICNLRNATVAQNQMNRRKRKFSSSKWKGVHWSKIHNKWRARLQFLNKSICLGFHRNEADAARAYNEGAKQYFGEFAHLNEGV